MASKLEELKEKYSAAKHLVKTWEDAYRKEKHEKPNKEALNSAPSDIKAAYKMYWKLARQIKEWKYDKNSYNSIKSTVISSSLSNPEKLPDQTISDCDHESTNPNPQSISSESNIQNLLTDTCSDNYVNSDTFITSHSDIDFKKEKNKENLDNANSICSKAIWGRHLNKTSMLSENKSFEFSLYTKMAENMKNHAVVKTRTSLKRLPSKNSVDQQNLPKESVPPNLDSKVDDANEASNLNNVSDRLDKNNALQITAEDNQFASNLEFKSLVVKKSTFSIKSQSVNHLSIDKEAFSKEKFPRKLNENWVNRCTSFIDSTLDFDSNTNNTSNFGDQSLQIPVAELSSNSQNNESNSLKCNLKTNCDSGFYEDSPKELKSLNGDENSVNPDTSDSENKIFKFDENSSDNFHESSGYDGKTQVERKSKKDESIFQESTLHADEYLNKELPNSVDVRKKNKIVTKRKVDEGDHSARKKLKIMNETGDAFADGNVTNESYDTFSFSENEDDEWKPKSIAKSRNKKTSNKPQVKKKETSGRKRNIGNKTGKVLKKKANCKISEQESKSTEEAIREQPDNSQQLGIEEYDELCEIGNSKNAINVPKRKYLSKEERLKDKILNGKLNDNFVKINLKKKVFVRGKRRMTSEKYKRVEWKKKQVMKKAEDGDERSIKKLTCFRCGDFGHWATKCPGKVGDNLLSLDSYNEEESTYLTIQEAADLAKGVKDSPDENITRLYNVSSTNLDSKIDENLEDDDFSDWEDDLVVSLGMTENEAEERVNKSGPFVFKDKDALQTVKPLYSLNSDSSISDTPSEVIETLELFGHKSFRKGQEEAIMRILSGQSTLVVQSTGSGKSLCYQLPAYLYAKHFNCITLCVSPLVSLMEDQVTGLPSFLKAVCLHTQQSSTNREKALNDLRSGNVHILLVSPEAVVSSSGGGVLGALLKELPPISFACLDEAHCLSEWSHNFRPSYLQVCQILKDRLNVHTFLGLTATARKETAVSIAKHLHIPSLTQGVIMGTCIPDNLMLSVSRDKNREKALLQLLIGERLNNCTSIIVYCTRREECERIATFIRIQMLTTSHIDVKNNAKRQRGISLDAEAYHAGLSGYRRQQIQKRFMSGKLRIVVATVAFGMGIDKADVQGIIHYNMPRNLESYVQEIGRAGRDGNTAHCHLFLDSSDGNDIQELKRHIFVNSVDRFIVRKLLSKIFIPGKCAKANKLLENSETEKEMDEKVITSDENYEILNHNKECPGHEVALPISQLVEALDLPEENIQTLLCYLENHSKCRLKLSHHAYATCKVSCYKGPKQLCIVSKKCPPLALALALQRKEKDFRRISSISFPVIEIASLMGWQSGTVKKELKNLEWDGSGLSVKPSGVKVEFCDLAFHMTCRCDLTEEDQDNILEDIYDRACTQEKDQLKKLQYTYEVLRQNSTPVIENSCDVVDEEKSDTLKDKVRDYFSTCNEKGLSSISLEEQLYIRPEIEQRIQSDIRAFISIHSDHSWTGRAVARVFHGISSPNFPSKVWGKVRRFWRSHLETDFNLLVSIATKEILKFR